MTVFGFPILAFLPVFTREVFHGGPETFATLLSWSGAGSVVGALIVAAMGRTRNLGKSALMMLLAFGIATTSFALSGKLFWSCLFLFLAGAAMISVFALVSSLVQLITSDHMRGRVMSVYNVAFRGGMPVGSIVVGAVVARLGAPLVIAVNGVVLVMIAFYFLFVHRRIASL
jgi:predicted MFS family arabinose efflux permease